MERDRRIKVAQVLYHRGADPGPIGIFCLKSLVAFFPRVHYQIVTPPLPADLGGIEGLCGYVLCGACQIG